MGERINIKTEKFGKKHKCRVLIDIFFGGSKTKTKKIKLENICITLKKISKIINLGPGYKKNQK